MPKTLPRYDRVAIALHWAIAISIILLGLTELLRGEIFAKGSAPREFLKALHEPIALLVFVLILARVAWRASHHAPALPASMTHWETLLAKLAHIALYALMLIVPILGLATTYARGRGIDFGVLAIPPFGSGLPRPTARAIKQAHELASIAILLLAGAHAAAGLYHHYVRGDDVMRRMLPRTRA